jgi:hypothetical protein
MNAPFLQQQDNFVYKNGLMQKLHLLIAWIWSLSSSIEISGFT